MTSEYLKAIEDLNLLQSNTQAVALAKYKDPKKILPLFKKQLELAGITQEDLTKLHIIHVSGTKGKGSTCAFIESIIYKSRERVGLYNSPHLVKVSERIRINCRPIEDDKFTKYFRQVFDKLTIETKKEHISMPSYFSFLTILAFHVFIQEKIDCAVIEVGIGGQYDPTNIVEYPVACGISTLDFDHVGILGKTIEEIAWNKAGIVKKDAPLFTVEHQHPNAIEVIKSRAREMKVPLYICKPFHKEENLRLGIRGSAQYSNAALACQMAMYFLDTVRFKNYRNDLVITDEGTVRTNLHSMPQFFKHALSNTTLLGRCQIVNFARVLFFLDGAHTRKSIENCLDWFIEASQNNDDLVEKILMINIIGDRDKKEVLTPLVKYNSFKIVMFATNRIDEKISDSSQLDDFSKSYNDDKTVNNSQLNADTWKSLCCDFNQPEETKIIMPTTTGCINFISNLLGRSPEKQYHVLVTGSLHFVGAMMKTLENYEFNLELKNLNK